jgi:plastocyanin
VVAAEPKLLGLDLSERWGLSVRFLSVGMTLATALMVCACGANNPTGPGSTPIAPAEAPRLVTVDVAEINGPYSFFPSPVLVAPDQTVVWRNLDTVTHHVVLDAGSIDTGTLAPNTLSQPMTIGPGTWSYHCSIHPAMVGSVTVASP